MIRIAVLLLLLANAVYFAWSQGLLAAWGLGPVQQSEPQRLGQQIRPQAIRLLSLDEARRADAGAGPASGAGAASGAGECFQAGFFSDVEADALRKALIKWPSSSWTLEPTVEAPRWIVYMGKYPIPEALAKKKAELRYIGVAFETVTAPALEPGLALGAYPDEAAARQQLEILSQKGVRTARVVLERPEARGRLLKLLSVDETSKPRLDELRPALNGKPLRACR